MAFRRLVAQTEGLKNGEEFVDSSGAGVALGDGPHAAQSPVGGFEALGGPRQAIHQGRRVRQPPAGVGQATQDLVLRVALSLASSGHQVTVVEPAGYPYEHPNLTVARQTLDDGGEARVEAVSTALSVKSSVPLQR